MARRLAQGKVGRLVAGDAPYWLMPLQLDGDYQIRRHSPYGSMREAIADVAASFARSAPPEAKLVVKGHPLDNGLTACVFNQSSLAIHFIAHPVLTVQRDASGQLKDLPEEPGKNDGDLIESWQLFEVDRVADEKGLNALRARILSTLEDVRSATSDWLEMRRRARTIAGELESQTPGLPSTEVIESKELLEWMEDNHFTFLGYREYTLEELDGDDVLRAVPGTGLGILRFDQDQSEAFARLPEPVATGVAAVTTSSRSASRRPGRSRAGVPPTPSR